MPRRFPSPVLLAILAVLALLAAACGGDDSAESGGGLGELSQRATTTGEGRTNTTTAPTTTSVAPTTTTEPPRRITRPTQLAATLLTAADLQGYGERVVTDPTAGWGVESDPPACGDALTALDEGQQIGLSDYYTHLDQYTSVTQWVSTSSRTDLDVLLDELRAAWSGPCATPFFTESLGWASGTLHYELLADPAVGEGAIATALHMDVVQEGEHVQAVSYMVTARRANVVFNVQVLTGSATSGRFTGPPMSIDDAIAYASIVDQRIVEQLGA